MATHSSILAWEISWTDEPSGLLSMGLQNVRHDWATNRIILGFLNNCTATHAPLSVIPSVWSCRHSPETTGCHHAQTFWETSSWVYLTANSVDVTSFRKSLKALWWKVEEWEGWYSGEMLVVRHSSKIAGPIDSWKWLHKNPHLGRGLWVTSF